MRAKPLYIALFLLLIGFLSSQLLPFEGLIHILSQPKPVVAPDAGCTLANQILAANTDQAVGDCPAGDSLDTIEINEDILLREPLPKITSDIVILGNGHTVSGDNKHRIFLVQGANLTIRDLTMTNGHAEQGGAILTLFGSHVRIVDSVISNSRALNGGAIYNRVGTVSLLDSAIMHNRAGEFGGGIFSKAKLLVKRSSFVDNIARGGGAIYVRSYGSRISNSTFSGNRATSTGGALFFDKSRYIELTHVTVTGNAAATGGGLLANRRGVTLVNSILANNLGGDCDTPLESSIASLIADQTCESAFSGDPLLQGLSGNLPYHAPEAASPAIGVGNPSLCADSDQLGAQRPQGKCDIGAIQAAD